MSTRIELRVAITAFIALYSSSVCAVDGVLEINQACVAVGCFPGDDPGFPIQIENAGSYRLTSDIVLIGPAQTRILVTADDVTIDLNGFTVAGPITCSGFPVQCTDKGPVGNGIDASSASGVEVRNGVVRGNFHGVKLGEQGRVEGVRAMHNGGIGISIGRGGIVDACTAVLNGSYGIFALTGSLVYGNTASENGGHGISVATAGLVGKNLARLNGGDGIWTNFWVSVIGNTATENGNGDPSHVGIRGNQGVAIGNTASFNSGVGLSMGLVGGGYAMNVVTLNNGGNVNPQVEGGIEMGGNVCGDDTSCP